MTLLTDKEKQEIAESPLFVCIIPEGPLPQHGAEQLSYAVSVGASIIYWLLGERASAVPGYPGVVIKGGHEQVAEAIRQFFEADEGFEILDGAYCQEDPTP